MGVGGRADHHGVDVGTGADCVNRADLAAISIRHILCGLGHRISNRHQPRPGSAGDGFGMNAADAACTEDAETKSHVSNPKVRC